MNRLKASYLTTSLPELMTGFAVWLGFALRLRQYFFNRSLWLDEAFIAVAIRDGTWKEACVPPLEYSHVVPPLFCALSKLVITVLGPQDYIFRLVPLFFGCAALVLFYYLVRNVFIQNRWMVFLSVLLFSLSPAMIYYSVEFKQYAGDVFFSVLLAWLWMVWRARQDKSIRSWALLWSGLVGTWFSLPLIFVLAAIGVDMGCAFIRRENGTRRWMNGLVPALWAMNFLAMHLLVIRPATINNPLHPWLLCFWGDIEKAFLPSSMQQWPHWFFLSFYKLFYGDRGIPVNALVGAGLFLSGLVYLFKVQRRLLMLWALTGLLMLAASSMRTYPLAGRMILFVRPYLLIGLVAGVSGLLAVLRFRKKTVVTGMVAGLICICLFLDFVIFAFHDAVHPIQRQEMKQVLSRLQECRKPNDPVYIYYWAEPAFRFYAADYGFDFDQFGLVEGHPESPYFFEVCYARARREAGMMRPNCRLLLGSTFDVVAMLDQISRQGFHPCRSWLVISHMGGDDQAQLIETLKHRAALGLYHEACGAAVVVVCDEVLN